MSKKVIAVYIVIAMISVFFAEVGISPGGTGKARAEEVPATKFVDCFEPMPVIGGLNEDCWGAADVGPRDQDNGLEDRTMGTYSYWDGGIIKGDDGRFYMFGSRWPERLGHEGWFESVAVYAVSDNLYGPYEDKGVLWPDYYDGAGHNVFSFCLSENDPLYEEGYRYAVCVSDVHKGVGYAGYSPANGSIHIAKNIEGPWELVDNGNNGVMKTSRNMGLVNVSVAVNPNGGYVAINRYGDIATTDSLKDQWTVHVKGLWSQVPGMPVSAQCVEDAVTWYSNGMFHIVVNKWDARIAYYLTSENGIDGWQLHTGAAYTPDHDFIRYEDGTVNNWYKVERPNVYIENDVVKAMIFSAIDTIKDKDKGGDEHGSKIIVVPFSSEKLEYLATHEDPLVSRPGGEPVADTSLFTRNYNDNYGDSLYMYLRRDKNYDEGLIGDGTFDENADNKIGLIKYDLSECTEGSGEISEAYLSLVYLSEKDEGNPSALWIVDDEFVKNKREQIKVVLAASNWEEHSVTADTRPDMLYDLDNPKYALSDVFIPTSGGLSEVRIDVTELVKEYVEQYPDEKMISFGLNETADGYDINIGTKETGSAFSPRLSVVRGSREVPVAPVPTSTPDVNEQKTPVLNKYNITYHMDNGMNNADNPNVYCNENIALKAPVRKGYLFKGWYTDANMTAKITSITAGMQGNLDLYAKWQKVKVAKPKITSAVRKKNGKIVVKFKVSGKAAGYEVVYGTDRKLKKKTKMINVKNSSATLKKIKGKKVYYVKVKAYKIDSAGKKVYGKYSAIKKISIKK